MADAIAQIAEFFRRLHGEEAFGHLIVWTRQDKATRAFDLGIEGALAAAAEYSRQRAETCDVYAAVGLQRSPPAGSGRGAEDGVCSIPAVWADVDIAGPAHSSKELPPTEQDAFALIEAVGLPPSIIVRSGFGLQVYWRYKEPWRLETAADRSAAKSLSTRFQALLRQLARSRGWGLDSTPDLCRVLRVPGTFNRKLPPDIRPVTVEYRECGVQPGRSRRDPGGHRRSRPSASAPRDAGVASAGQASDDPGGLHLDATLPGRRPQPAGAGMVSHDHGGRAMRRCRTLGA